MKFNTKPINNSNKPDTINYEREPSFSKSEELELYSMVVTSMMDDKYYESNSDFIIRLRNLISKNDPEFVCKLAIYAREQMYLRSIPIVLLCELNKILTQENKERTYLNKVITRIIQRADEITEFLAYYQLINSQNEKQVELKNNVKIKKKLCKLSNQVKIGIRNSFHKFDEYQFSKYNKDSEIKLRDAMFLTHPTSFDDNEKELFNKIANNKLSIPYTWEVELSNIKQSGKTKTQIWEELIDSNRLNIMALIRNLRNIIQSNVSQQHIVKICNRLKNKEEILKSKQFPYRFLSAYLEIYNLGINNNYENMICNALDDAIINSVECLKGFDYNTSVLIACDVSGSMNSSITQKSKIEMYHIGLILGLLLKNKSKNNILGLFGTEFKLPTGLIDKTVLGNYTKLKELSCQVGWSTNGYKVIEYLLDNNKSVDKIMIFTDCQMWNSLYDGKTFNNLWLKYIKTINKNAKLYLFDLTGYKTTPVKCYSDNVYVIGGWSDKIFDMLDSIENHQTYLNIINQIKI
jgi:60 kDa SS-A/Ro ribonucleoprotein